MFYDDLVEFLKENDKSIDDIEFIQSYRYNYDDEIYSFEIDIEDFKTIAKDIESSDSSDTLKFVGKDWWITTDTDEGYFEIYEIPIKPKKKINLAKELLLNQDTKLGYILGIEWE